MIFAATITTEAKREKIDPLETVLKVSKGLVWRIEIEYPPGCSGLMHCQIFDGSYQVFPASPGESIHSDALLIGFDDLYLKTSEPFEFVIKTWNLDETWDHTVQVRLGMASSDAFMSRYAPELSLYQQSKVFKKIEDDQEALRVAQIEAMANELKL